MSTNEHAARIVTEKSTTHPWRGGSTYPWRVRCGSTHPIGACGAVFVADMRGLGGRGSPDYLSEARAALSLTDCTMLAIST